MSDTTLKSEISKANGKKAAALHPAPSAGRGSDRLQILKTYKIYIDGKFPRTESGRTFVYDFKNSAGSANLCQCSRKDARDAITAARAAFPKWSQATSYNRGQILYRIAEMLEGRRAQFIEELQQQGLARELAEREVAASIDCLVYYAGWSDKYQQIFSAVNPVSASYFNFSILEPTGVVSIFAPEGNSLLGLVQTVAPVIVGGNTCVVLASEKLPLCAVTFAEVLQSSDVPAGVVNLLTGFRKELLAPLASHMDVNALIHCGERPEEIQAVQTHAALNVKRCVQIPGEPKDSPYLILETQEVKTTWHPIGI